MTLTLNESQNVLYVFCAKLLPDKLGLIQVPGTVIPSRTLRAVLCPGTEQLTLSRHTWHTHIMNIKASLEMWTVLKCPANRLHSSVPREWLQVVTCGSPRLLIPTWVITLRSGWCGSYRAWMTRATVTPQNPSADRSENGPTGSDLDQGNIFTECKANPLSRALTGLIGQYH